MINWLYYNYWSRSVAMAFLIPIFCIWFSVSFFNAEFMTLNIFDWRDEARGIILIMGICIMLARLAYLNFKE